MTMAEERKDMRVVNHAVPKVDAQALVTGKAVYTNDLAPFDSLIVKIVRSPHAHALIKDINRARAEAVPGIECVLTYKDCPDKRFTMAGQTYPEPSPYDRLILDQRMRFVGDAAAIVAGTSEEAVRKAMKLVKIKYEVLEPVLDFRQAKDNPILVHPEDTYPSVTATIGFQPFESGLPIVKGCGSHVHRHGLFSVLLDGTPLPVAPVAAHVYRGTGVSELEVVPVNVFRSHCGLFLSVGWHAPSGRHCPLRPYP